MLSHPLLHLQHRATCSRARPGCAVQPSSPLLHWKNVSSQLQSIFLSSPVKFSPASLQASFPSRQPWHMKPEWHGQGSMLSITLCLFLEHNCLFLIICPVHCCHISLLLFLSIHVIYPL